MTFKQYEALVAHLESQLARVTQSLKMEREYRRASHALISHEADCPAASSHEMKCICPYGDLMKLDEHLDVRRELDGVGP